MPLRGTEILIGENQLKINKMNKKILQVPAGIRFFKDWKEFDIVNYQFPFILNKVATGCGFTTYALENPYPTILCSPRKKLLENKYQQTPGSFYLDFQPDDKEVDIIRKGQELGQYLSTTQLPKILCTYDSFKHVRSIVGEEYIGLFYVIVDEFSNIFIDSQFKGDTELEFVSYLKDLSKVCFVSATPYIEEYLDEVDVFKDLPYLELDWDALEKDRLVKPNLSVVQQISSITEKISFIIKKYLSGKFDCRFYKDKDGVHSVESKEAVFFVNSVEHIIRAIKKNSLTPDQVNIIVSETNNANKAKLKKIGHTFGRIPLKGEKHKMFTFCTSTAYIGSDFYSTNARTFIFADGNIDCLAVDISMDLPQILGRQRLDENPWKGEAEFYYKTNFNPTYSLELINERLQDSESTLEWFEEVKEPERRKKFLRFVKKDNINFQTNYLSVSDKGTLEYNKLAYIAQKRAYEISCIDYKDRFQVLNTIGKSKYFGESLSGKQQSFLTTISSFKTIDEKLRYFVYNTDLTEEEKKLLYGRKEIPYSIEQIYEVLGPSRVKALACDFDRCIDELYELSLFSKGDFKKLIYQEFKEGETYTNADLKEKLQGIYEDCFEISRKKMSASDMSRYFELKQTKTTIDGKRVVCQTLLKKKE